MGGDEAGLGLRPGLGSRGRCKGLVAKVFLTLGPSENLPGEYDDSLDSLRGVFVLLKPFSETTKIGLAGTPCDCNVLRQARRLGSLCVSAVLGFRSCRTRTDLPLSKATAESSTVLVKTRELRWQPHSVPSYRTW